MRSLLILAAFVASALAWDGWSTNDTDLVMGMNVGSYFVPEAWMMQPFIQCYAEGTDDAWGLMSMPAATVESVMINHLDNYIREVDFSDAQARGVNMVRIPVAFWMFIPTEGDEPYWTDSRQKDFYLPQLLSWAQKYGMEVAIDIHALPGAQNTDAHSGRNLVNAGLEPSFYNSTNLIRGNATVDAIIEWVQGLNSSLQSTIAMIELANEPTISQPGAYEALVGFYQANQAKIASLLPNVWTMISDGWLGSDNWGTVFTPDDQVVMDLHWWNMFGTPPTLEGLQTMYCNLTAPTGSTAWKNPIIVGEFAAAQNNYSITSWMSSLQKLQFYQTYYSTQLYAARGSGGTLPQYRGAFMWNMVCNDCAPVWQPYYIGGDWADLAVTGPNWCDNTPAPTTYTLAINPTPTHSADTCGLYGTVDAEATATSSGGSPFGTNSAGSRLQPLKEPLIYLGLLVTIVCAAIGQ